MTGADETAQGQPPAGSFDPLAIAGRVANRTSAAFRNTIGGLGMTIESDDLAILRETTSKTLLAVLWLHVPIAVTIGMMRGTDWLVPAALMVAMALAATAVVARFGERTINPPDLCRRPDGRRIGVCLSARGASLADRHAHVFLRRAGLSGRLLRLSADPCRHGGGRAASSGAEFHASGGDLSGRRRSRPRRAPRRHPADRGRRTGLAGAARSRICSRPPRRRPPRPKPRAPPKPAPISTASRPNGRPSRTATRRGANSPQASSARSAASSRPSR